MPEETALRLTIGLRHWLLNLIYLVPTTNLQVPFNPHIRLVFRNGNESSFSKIS